MSSIRKHLSRYRGVYAWALFCSWLILVSFWSWQLFFKSDRAFSESLDVLSDINLQLISPGKTTLVHFVDAQCGCNRFAMPHIRDIEKRYPDYRHVIVDAMKPLPTLFHKFSVDDLVVSSPSVALFGEAGQLRYYGPYSSGLVCGQGEDLIARAVNSMRQDKGFHWINLIGFGCYCPWKGLKTI